MLSEELADWAMASQAAGHVNCLRNLVQSDRERMTDVFDADPMVINVRNGTLEVRKRDSEEPYVQLRRTATRGPDHQACRGWNTTRRQRARSSTPSSPKCSPTKRCGASSTSGAACPSPATSASRSCVFFYGKGRNGKGVYVETLKFIAGSYTETVPIETFLDSGRARRGGEATPDLAILPGVRYLTTSERGEGAPSLAEGLIKLCHRRRHDVKARHL